MSTTPVRILHIITGLQTGGAEMMLLKLLSKHTTDIAPFVVVLGGTGSISKKIESLGITVTSLGMVGDRPPSPATLLRLFMLVRHCKPNVIQGWMYHGNLMALLAGFFTTGRTPVLWNIRHSLYNLSSDKRLTVGIIRLGAKVSMLPRGIIYNSRTSALQHEQLGYTGKRTIIMPNGFDPQLFHPSGEARSSLRRKLGVADSIRLIGLIARYHPVKDHENFVSAAAILTSQREDVHFVLAGHGVDVNNQKLMKSIEDKNLQRRIHLMGEQENVPEITAALDIATSSSLSEAFPNVIGEAMSCGIPCVVTNVGDSSFIVGDTGRVVPPADPKALASGWAAILDMKNEQRRALSEAARQRILQNYSLPNIVASYERLYSNMAKMKSPEPPRFS